MRALLVIGVLLLGSAARVAAQPGLYAPVAEQPAPVAPSDRPHRELALGYRRGSGLGNYGVEVMYTLSDRVTASASAFGFVSDGQRGFALMPAIRYNLVGLYRSGPYFEASAQYMRFWFGDVAAGGFGGSGDFGFEWRLSNGLGFDLGLGFNLKQTIRGSSGMTTVEQAPTFGLHWDAALRYWFGK